MSLLPAWLALLGLSQSPPAGAQAARVILDQPSSQGRLIVEGKPFFPLGWYGNGDARQLEKLAGTPFNCILDYGMTGRPIEQTKAYLDAAHQRGIKVIFCINDVYPSATYVTRLGEWVGNEAILRGVVSTFRDHPALIAWYNNDELPVEKVPEIEGYYRAIAELDPAHPQLLVHYKTGSWRAFFNAADIIGLDHYPIPSRPVTALAEAIDTAMAETGGGKPIWAVIQNFAWYQHRDVVEPVVAGDRDTPRSRLPTPEEWTKGRPPTRDELRAMTWLSIIHGVRGILYWCLYNMEYLPDRAERWQDAVAIAAEAARLAPVILEPSGERIQSSEPGIHALLKRHAGKRYLLTVNGTAEPLRVSFPVGPASTPVRVEFEDRTLSTSRDRLTDFFAPLQRHIYVWEE